MQVKTDYPQSRPEVHAQKFKSFVYGGVRWVDGPEGRLAVEVVKRANDRPVCSHCGDAAAVYDRLGVWHFEFVPLWGIRVFLIYGPVAGAVPNLQCASGGAALGERQAPADASLRLVSGPLGAGLSWKEVATVFHASWDSVFRSVEMPVEWGCAHQNLSGIQAIGIVEIAIQRLWQLATS